MFFKKAHVRKIIQFSEGQVAANFDITPTSIHIKSFTGHIYDWSILNDKPTPKGDLLTPILRKLCEIAKYLAHAVPTCKTEKRIVNVWFSVLIYKIFKAFMEAMMYALFEVTTSELKFLLQFLFLKIYQFLRESKNMLQLVIIFQEF